MIWGMLALFSVLKGQSLGMNKIAKEYALVLGECPFMPDVDSHTPGISNVLADSASRQFEAGGFPLHPLLTPALRVHPALRDEARWATFHFPEHD